MGTRGTAARVLSGAWAIVSVALALLSSDASALPLFARQTGQNCLACHAGGQFPELTPYGRMFKMTGYTIGERQTVPLSVMYYADYARIRDTSKSDSPQDDFMKNGIPAVGGGSLFLAGKVTDNIGVFIQDTYSNYVSGYANNNNGHSAADYVDLRYADRFVDANRDVVFGVSLNNRPTGTDPSSAAPAWMQYVPGTAVSSRMGADFNSPYGTVPNNVAGINAYLFWNKTIYAEVGAYQTANRAFSFMTSGLPDASTPHLKGTNPYWRLAYSHEWGPHNVLVGMSGMRQDIYDLGTDTSDPGNLGKIRNTGVDAQYQYLLDPHTITAQFAYMRQKVDNSPNMTATVSPYFLADGVTPVAAANSSDTINTLRLKLSYIYRATYGGSVSFFNRTGTTDTLLQTSGYDSTGLITTNDPNNTGIASTRVTGNLSGNPATRGFTYEAFVIPIQYVRVGVQYTMYNKFNGASTNYDGFGRNANDNNTLYFYVWGAY